MASTLTAGDVFGSLQGYYTTFAVGSLSPELSPSGTTQILVTGATASRISWAIPGDHTAALASLTHLKVDGTDYAVTSGPSFDGSSTEVEFGPASNFVVGNSYSLELVGLGGGPTYAGPTYIGKSTAAGNASATSVDFSSSGRTSGDQLYLAVTTANQALSAPSGFTEVSSSPQSMGTAGAAGGVRLYVFEKTSDGTETTVSIGDSGSFQYAVGIVVRKSADDEVAIDASNGGTSTASTSGSFSGVTTTGDERLVLTFVATDRDSSSASWSGEANASLANLTERHDLGTTAGAGGGIAIYTGEKQAAGATGTTTATQAVSEEYVWITLAVANAEAGADPITGTLSAQETGSDTAAVSGTVDVSGTVSAQETGSDSASASGAVAVSGSLAVQEAGADSFSATGTVSNPGVTGTLAAQEAGSDSFSGAGSVAIAGEMAAQETGSDNLTSSGSVEVSGAAAVQEVGSDSATASGATTVSGSLAVQENGSDTFAGFGSAATSGTLSAQEVGSDTASATGTVAVSGTLAAQETGSDTFTASGGVATEGVTGTLSAQEAGNDTLAASGAVVVTGVFSAPESGTDGFAATGSTGISGTFTAQEAANDNFAATGTVDVSGAFSAQETGADEFYGYGLVAYYNQRPGAFFAVF